MTTIDIIALWGKYILLPLVSAVFGAATKGWIENRRFLKLEKSRDIVGRWRGELRYIKPKQPAESIEIEFYRYRFWNLPYWLDSKLIRGVVRSGNDTDGDLFIQGGFYQPDQLMLDYQSSQAVRRQFGSVILKLDASGGTLFGNFIGHYDEPLVGALSLERGRK
ncbi:hypothetical protein QRQ56_28955 [Bradyrhizobium sp. U531]|uniref:hypothetical protein n=1 Tax=Bradyrhizobium sp. U531 TaxID=3053458 RepID=UPI003F426011